MNHPTKQQVEQWKQALVPLYGERECLNLWRWYLEDKRNPDLFEQDLSRLKASCPIQYLLGYTWFYGRKMVVDEHTLIPRPETEELVYRILEENGDEKALRVLDIGTGTGCIALTLGMEQPSWTITGVDISEKALEIACRNSRLHDTSSIRWEIANILDWKKFPVLNKPYDLIVSNPPYISYEEKVNMDKNVVDYEPHLALFTSDREGLEFYKAIEAFASEILTEEGQVFLELHEGNSAAIEELFRENAYFCNIIVSKDMQEKNRILQAKKRTSKGT